MICPACKTANIEGADACANCGQALYGLDLPGGGEKYAIPPFIADRLGTLPRRTVETVGVDDPVTLAVRRMQTGNAGAVIVIDGERVTGIITAMDILHRVAGADKDLNAVTCRQVMTPDPVVFQDDDSIALAINKMSVGDYRHIPIVQDGRPVNIIDVNDLFRHLSLYLV